MAVFDILLVAQAGRIQFESLLFCASLREMAPGFAGRVIVAEPQPGGAWPGDPRIDHPGLRRGLVRLGAEIRPLVAHHFGAAYPQGNKIEALTAMAEGPALFFDSDTLVTGELRGLEIRRPAASLRREPTWPKLQPQGPGLAEIWGALYRRFGLDFAASQDPQHGPEDWQRYLYLNAGWVAAPNGGALGALWSTMAREIRAAPPPELKGQSLDPWLDQVSLPLALSALDGGRPGPEMAGLDGALTCHYRTLPLLFARESEQVVAVLRAVTARPWLKKILKDYDPFRRFLYQGLGDRARALFDRAALPSQELLIRKRLKSHNLWMR